MATVGFKGLMRLKAENIESAYLYSRWL